jgi:hypothetical protein
VILKWRGEFTPYLHAPSARISREEDRDPPPAKHIAKSTVNKKRQLVPGHPPTSLGSLNCVAALAECRDLAVQQTPCARLPPLKYGPGTGLLTCFPFATLGVRVPWNTRRRTGFGPRAQDRLTRVRLPSTRNLSPLRPSGNARDGVRQTSSKLIARRTVEARRMPCRFNTKPPDIH